MRGAEEGLGRGREGAERDRMLTVRDCGPRRLGAARGSACSVRQLENGEVMVWVVSLPWLGLTRMDQLLSLAWSRRRRSPRELAAHRGQRDAVAVSDTKIPTVTGAVKGTPCLPFLGWVLCAPKAESRAGRLGYPTHRRSELSCAGKCVCGCVRCARVCHTDRVWECHCSRS